MEAVLWSLIAIFTITQGFWIWSTHALINKVMSGTYTTYVQNERQLKIKPKDPKQNVAPIDSKFDQDLEIMNNVARSMRM